MMSVLLLNTTYEPMHVVSLRRAVALVLQEKAQLVEASERTVRSPSLAMPEPLVIRLRGRVTMLRQRSLALSRTAILARDGYTCQYCGLPLPAARLTIDHVLPQSRGGAWAWTNLVAACPACNAASRASPSARRPRCCTTLSATQSGAPISGQLEDWDDRIRV